MKEFSPKTKAVMEHRTNIVIDHLNRLRSLDAPTPWLEAGKTLSKHYEDGEYVEKLAANFLQTATTPSVGNSLPHADKFLKKALAKAPVIKDRVYILSSTLVAKINNSHEDRNDTLHEVAVGTALNDLRLHDLPAPNFVYTVGAFQAPLMIKDTTNPPKGFEFGRDYNYVVTEFIDGEQFAHFRGKRELSELMPLILQVIFALRMGYIKYKITHYDLHGGNVLIHPTKNKKKVTYPWGTVATNYYATIIDTGRSYAEIEGQGIGRVIEKHAVYEKPYPFYDIYFFLQRIISSRLYKNPDIRALLTFFGMPEFNPDVHLDMPVIIRRSYNWDSFVELLYSLNSTRNCLIRPTEPVPIPVAAAPLIEAVVVSKPDNPTTKELETWFRSQRTPEVRLEVMTILNADRSRLDQLNAVLAKAVKPISGPELKDINVERLREQDHSLLLTDLGRLVSMTPSSQLRAPLIGLVNYYKARLVVWNNILENIFGG